VESNLVLAPGEGQEPAEEEASAAGAPRPESASLTRGLNMLRRR
jgi:hypothetical protein